MQFLTFSKTIRIRMLLNFFSISTHTMVMPFTVVYFSNSIGSALTTTMIIIIGIISMIGYLIGGRATDYFGRKVIIILSEVVAGLGFIAISYFDYIPTFYVVPIIIAFSIIYFFQSAANPAYSAIIIDSSEESERKTIYTYFMWVSSVSFSLGSVIGGFYFENHSSLLFFIVGSTSFISAFLTHFLIKEQPLPQLDVNEQKVKATNSEPITKVTRRFNVFGVFAYRLFLFLCIGQFLISLLSEQFPNYISIRIVGNYPVDNFSITGYQMIGYLNLEYTLLIALGAGIILKLTKNRTEKSSLVIGLVLNIVGYLSLSYLTHPIFLVIGMFFVSTGFLTYRPVEQTIIANSIPEHSRGKYLSILGLMGAFGGMTSSLFIWGMEYISALGISIIFLCIGIVIIFNYLKVIKHTENNTKEIQTKVSMQESTEPQILG